MRAHTKKSSQTYHKLKAQKVDVLVNQIPIELFSCHTYTTTTHCFNFFSFVMSRKICVELKQRLSKRRKYPGGIIPVCHRIIAFSFLSLLNIKWWLELD